MLCTIHTPLYLPFLKLMSMSFSIYITLTLNCHPNCTLEGFYQSVNQSGLCQTLWIKCLKSKYSMKNHAVLRNQMIDVGILSFHT